MKIYINSDEWYPVYSVEKDSRFGTLVDVPAATVERWQRIDAEFEAIQVEMRDALERKPAA